MFVVNNWQQNGNKKMTWQHRYDTWKFGIYKMVVWPVAVEVQSRNPVDGGVCWRINYGVFVLTYIAMETEWHARQIQALGVALDSCDALYLLSSFTYTTEQ